MNLYDKYILIVKICWKYCLILTNQLAVTWHFVSQQVKLWSMP